MNKPLVILRGPCLSLSGYGIHCRQAFDYLLGLERNGHIELVCDALPWGNTTWIVDPERDPLARELMKRCRKADRKPDVSVQVQLPNEWDPKLATRLNIGVTAAVETDLAPAGWATACQSMDAVVFPSEHAKKSILAAGWKPKDAQALVVPESYPDALRDPPSPAAIAQLDDLPSFTFLVFGQVTGEDTKCDRKGVIDAVSWLSEEFAGDKDVGILVKANVGRSTTFDLYHVENILNAARKKSAAKANGKKLPELHLVHGDMPDADVCALYKHPKIAALVSPTKGEGFGLPLLEAAACGLPIIATGWSAHVEFLGKGRYVDLPCVVKPIPKEKADGKIFVPGSRWAEVPEDDFKKRLRKFRSSPSIPRGWAKELAEIIKREYSRESVCGLWDAAIGERLRSLTP